MFDAIILDLVFDEGSGWDVCEYVKKIILKFQ